MGMMLLLSNVLYTGVQLALIVVLHEVVAWDHTTDGGGASANATNATSLVAPNLEAFVFVCPTSAIVTWSLMLCACT